MEAGRRLLVWKLADISRLQCADVPTTRQSPSKPLEKHKPSLGVMPSSEQQYFIPGWGIRPRLISSQMELYLGPNATVRPYTYCGREGYLVTARSQPLTRVSDFCLYGAITLLSNLLRYNLL